jgi:hypothetical protein
MSQNIPRDFRLLPQFCKRQRRWETQNRLFSQQSRKFCSDPNRQPSLTAFSVPLLPRPQYLGLFICGIFFGYLLRRLSLGVVSVPTPFFFFGLAQLPFVIPLTNAKPGSTRF